MQAIRFLQNPYAGAMVLCDRSNLRDTRMSSLRPACVVVCEVPVGLKRHSAWLSKAMTVLIQLTLGKPNAVDGSHTGSHRSSAYICHSARLLSLLIATIRSDTSDSCCTALEDHSFNFNFWRASCDVLG